MVDTQETAAAQATPQAAQSSPQASTQTAAPAAQPAAQAAAPAQAAAAPTQEPAKAAPADGKQQEAKPADGKTPEEKAKETAEQKPVVPEKYDLKLPEGSSLDQKVVDQVSQFAKEKGLTNEQAQAVLNDKSESVKAFHESAKAQLEAKRSEWLEAVKTDPELGGDKTAEHVELAKRFIDRFGSSKLKADLNLTGFGNHPEVVRMFAKLGKAMGEDKIVVDGQPLIQRKTAEEVLYGGSEVSNQ